MKTLKRSNTLLLNAILLITILLNGYFTFALIEISHTFKRWMPAAMWNAFIAVSGIAVIAEILLLVLSWTPFQVRFLKFIRSIPRKFARLGSYNLLIFSLLIVLHGFFVFGPVGQHIRNLPVFTFSLWLTSVLGAFLIKAWGINQNKDPSLKWIHALLIALLVTSFGHEISAALSRITDYPFTRDWSETSRYYYASLFFSEKLYGVQFPWPVLHPSEYLSLSIPYLLSNPTLLMLRTWQNLLIIIMPLITAFMVCRRFAIHGVRKWLLLIWIFLYLGIGPVYYHLLFPVILVLWGYDTNQSHSMRSRLFKSFLAVGLASIWAGISRVNWIPVPGILAATLYLLERPAIKRSNFENSELRDPSTGVRRIFNKIMSYLAEPVILVVAGSAIAVLSYAAYILLSGNPIEYFGTTYNSTLLWYRLLPSPTYPPGILTGTLIISLPLFLLLLGKLLESLKSYPRYRKLHPIRPISLFIILLIFFIGGLVVSVKIGGGSNLHNMDAYLVLLLVITTAFILNHAVSDDYEGRHPDKNPVLVKENRRPEQLQQAGWMLSVVVLVLFTLLAYTPPNLTPMDKEIKRSAQAIDKYIQDVKENNGDILYISNRHMLIFDDDNSIRLVPEYERVFLMEMAMAKNDEYLSHFYDDLSNHKFDLIITEPLYDQEKGASHVFGEENDIWVESITRPILCYYEEIRILRLVHVQILAPKEHGSMICTQGT